MAITTYSELKTAIGDWTVRDDLSGQYDTFIDLTESLFDLPPRRPSDAEIGGLRIAITEDTGTLTAGQAYISKPSTFVSALRFDLTGTTGGRVDYIAPDGMPLRFLEGTGQPKYWTVTDVIEFNISPDSAYAYSLKYYSSQTALSSSNTTNDVITSYPMVYLAGCLHFAFDYIQDDQRAMMWMQRYKQYAHAANQAFRQEMLTSGSLAAQAA